MRQYTRLKSGSSVILVINYKHLPRLFYFSLGALCSLLVATLVFEQRLDTLTAQQSQHYGSALSQMAAQQAVDATLNHDLVSLQVILQDVAANPGVVLATIHDVENNLLVQAGDAGAARNSEVPLSAHTAPITLHDSIAGYVTVTLVTNDNNRSLILAIVAAIALLLALIAGLSLRESREQFYFRGTPPASPDTTGAPDTTEPAEASEQTAILNHDDEIFAAQSDSAYVYLRVNNMGQLRQQLSADVFQATKQRFDQLLSDVLALYNGQLVTSPAPTNTPGNYMVQFQCQDDPIETLFRAACSAHLIMQLSEQLGRFPLELAAELAMGDSFHAMRDTAATRSWTGLLIAKDTAQQPLLQRRLVLADAPEQADKYRVTGFQQPFASLLRKQCIQLNQMRG